MMSKEVKTQRGFVAFFDILGYQNLIVNNDIEKAASIVSEILVKLPEMTQQSLRKWLPGPVTRFDHIRARSISDSILILMPVVESTDVLESMNSGISFLMYCSRLIRLSFDEGLPLRGAMDHGDFFMDSDCFAGQPIIDCYRLSQEMQCAGGVLTKGCSSKIATLMAAHAAGPKIAKKLIFRHLVPFKNGQNTHHEVIDWVNQGSIWPAPQEDARHYVMACFHKHSKDIAPEVIPKVDNTEIMIRHAIGRSRTTETE